MKPLFGALSACCLALALMSVTAREDRTGKGELTAWLTLPSTAHLVPAPVGQVPPPEPLRLSALRRVVEKIVQELGGARNVLLTLGILAVAVAGLLALSAFWALPRYWRRDAGDS